MKKHILFFSLLLAAGLFASSSLMAQTNLITNGDFSNGFNDWTTQAGPTGVDQTTVWEDAGGFAFNDFSGGPSARLFYQDFTVPTGISAATFSIEYAQDNFNILDPQNLPTIEADPFDANGDGFAQNGFRVDIVDPAGNVFTTPILHELLAPQSDAGVVPNTLVLQPADPVALTTFLQSQGGNTLRLRFGQVESTFPWSIVIDNIELSVTANAPVPTLSQWGLILLGLVFVSFATVTLWRKRSSAKMA